MNGLTLEAAEKAIQKTLEEVLQKPQVQATFAGWQRENDPLLVERARAKERRLQLQNAVNEYEARQRAWMEKREKEEHAQEKKERPRQETEEKEERAREKKERARQETEEKEERAREKKERPGRKRRKKRNWRRHCERRPVPQQYIPVPQRRTPVPQPLLLTK